MIVSRLCPWYKAAVSRSVCIENLREILIFRENRESNALYVFTLYDSVNPRMELE